MDYKQHYDKLILSRKSLKRNKKDNVYYEKHHIIPKSCGGGNNDDNLVLLTFKEHFVAHILLTKIYDGDLKRKMYYALWRMAHNSKNHKRVLSSSQYSVCKEAEVIARKGHVVSSETRKKISKSNTGKKRSKEVVEKNRLRNIGLKQSEETKEKRRKKLKGISRAKYVVDKIIKNNTQRKMILCSNGIKYKSLSSAARELSLNQSNITAVCLGRRKSTGGYKFEFID